jgi:hypothetical protein
MVTRRQAQAVVPRSFLNVRPQTADRQELIEKFSNGSSNHVSTDQPAFWRIAFFTPTFAIK